MPEAMVHMFAPPCKHPSGAHARNVVLFSFCVCPVASKRQTVFTVVSQITFIADFFWRFPRRFDKWPGVYTTLHYRCVFIYHFYVSFAISTYTWLCYAAVVVYLVKLAFTYLNMHNNFAQW